MTQAHLCVRSFCLFANIAWLLPGSRKSLRGYSQTAGIFRQEAPTRRGSMGEQSKKQMARFLFFFFSILDKCSYVTKPSPDSAYFFFSLLKLT